MLFLCASLCAFFFFIVCLPSPVSHLQKCVAYEVVTAHAEDEIGAFVAAKDAAEERAANLHCFASGICTFVPVKQVKQVQ